MKKKIILTGSTGFVGKNLVKYLKKKNINFIKIQTKDILKRSIDYKNISHVLHVGFDMRKKGISISTQLKILENISINAKINDCKIIFLSSSCYGKFNKRKLYVNSNYQLAKKKCEDYLIKKREIGLNSIILRVFNLYGPGQKRGFIVSDAIFRINKNKSKTLKLHNHKNKRDFIFIDDLVKAIYKCIMTTISNRTIEIGTGKSYSIKFIYDKIQLFLNKKIKYLYKKPYKSKLPLTKAFIQKNKKIIKWEPKTNIQQGLKLVIKNDEKNCNII